MKKLICVLFLLVTAFIVFAQDSVINGESWNSYDKEAKEIALKGIANGQYSIIYYFHILGIEELSDKLHETFNTFLTVDEVIAGIDEYYMDSNHLEHYIFMAYLIVTGKIYEKKEVL